MQGCGLVVTILMSEGNDPKPNIFFKGALCVSAFKVVSIDNYNLYSHTHTQYTHAHNIHLHTQHTHTNLRSPGITV